MKLRTLAKFGTAIPSVLTTQEASADDETGAQVRMEQARYERAVLDISRICEPFSRKTRPRSELSCFQDIPRNLRGLPFPASKSSLGICSLEREIAELRKAVAALSRRAPRPDADKPAAREEVKQKRIAERAAAREEHAEFMAKQAAAKPVKDRAYAEWKAKDRERQLELKRNNSRNWRAANLEEHRRRTRELMRRKRADEREKMAASLAKRGSGWRECLSIEPAEKAEREEQIGSRIDLPKEAS